MSSSERYEQVMARVRSGSLARGTSASSTRSSATSVSSVSSSAASAQEEYKPRKKVKKIKKRKGTVTICTTDCKYDVVRRVSKRLGWKDVADDEDWFLYWTDTSVALERVMEMKGYQKINHFPGMSEITRKDNLARNLNRLYKQFPEDFDFFPKTWVLPADWSDFQNHIRAAKKTRTYIMKPESGCQGRGISLSRNPQRDIKPSEHMIVQEYLDKPFLMDGFKFDLRIYVLVTSCDPLRIFLYEDGLARFATEAYTEPSSKNVDNMFVHLTNYAINKNNENFVRSDDYEKGSKRSLESVKKWFAANGYDVTTLWDNVADIIIKTLTAAVPILSHNYRTCFPNHNTGSGCFEILGFDILIDRKMKPWVLEVNHSPSFTCDSKLDREIKEDVIGNALRLLNIATIDRKRCAEFERKRVQDRLLKGRRSPAEEKKEREEERKSWEKEMLEHELANIGNYTRIYPTETSSKYDKFLSGASSVFNETAASKARLELLRVQREDRELKKTKPLARRMSTGSAKDAADRRTLLSRRAASMTLKDSGSGDPEASDPENARTNNGGEAQGEENSAKIRNDALQATARRLSKYGRAAAEGAASAVKISDLTSALEQRLSKLSLSKIPSRTELSQSGRRRGSAAPDAAMETLLGEGCGVPYSEEEEAVRMRMLAEREGLVRAVGLRERLHDLLSGKEPAAMSSHALPQTRLFGRHTTTAAVLASAANALGRSVAHAEQEKLHNQIAQQVMAPAHVMVSSGKPPLPVPIAFRPTPSNPSGRSWLVTETDLDGGAANGRRLNRGLSLQLVNGDHAGAAGVAQAHAPVSAGPVYNYPAFPSHNNGGFSGGSSASHSASRSNKTVSLSILSERAPVGRRSEPLRPKPAMLSSTARNLS